MDRFRLDGRRALVTGASRGIGLAIAHTFAEAGAFVVIVARSQEALRDALRSSPTLCANGAVASFDLSDVEGIRGWYADLASEHGPFDVLVNNAGTNIRVPAAEMSWHDFDAVCRVDLGSIFALSQAFASLLLARGRDGRIVNIASIAGTVAVPTPAVAYASAKAGVIGMTRQLAIEWAPRILVNAIAPGYIATEMTASLPKPDMETWLQSRVPLGRWGHCREVADATLFLASPAASFITGQTLTIDGGLTTAL